MAATPPMTAAAPTPPSPLHGGRYDTYHATRKSTRQTATRRTRVDQTPPPPSNKLLQKLQSSRQKNTGITQPVQHFNSPPSSTQTSPRKKTKWNTETQATSAMNGEDSSRAPSEDPCHNPPPNPTHQQPAFKLGPNMLPTPVKTPRKKPIGQAALNAGGRVLFPDRPDDPMPVPRRNRKGKRHVGFSLYGSVDGHDDGMENEISIYTDSKDKVPELDLSEDNPFVDNPATVASHPEPGKKRQSRKRKAALEFDGSKEIEEAFNRKEGMVYVFRGKKVYRKFPKEDFEEEEEDHDNDNDNAAVETAEDARPRTLSRSSIKPRLLFPPSTQKSSRSKSDLEAEEAPTDIDDDPNATEPEHGLTPSQPETRTPVKTTFRGGLPPDTPPDTGHATRLAAAKKAATLTKDDSSSSSPPAISPVKLDFNKHASSQPPPTTKGKKGSPFDGWARTKPGAGAGAGAAGMGKGRKRAAAEVADEEGPTTTMKSPSTKRAKPNSVSEH